KWSQTTFAGSTACGGQDPPPTALAYACPCHAMDGVVGPTVPAGGTAAPADPVLSITATIATTANRMRQTTPHARQTCGVTEVTVRRARPDDLDFLLELVNDADVEPFLEVRAARTREALLEEIERSER